MSSAHTPDCKHFDCNWSIWAVMCHLIRLFFPYRLKIKPCKRSADLFWLRIDVRIMRCAVQCIPITECLASYLQHIHKSHLNLGHNFFRIRYSSRNCKWLSYRITACSRLVVSYSRAIPNIHAYIFNQIDGATLSDIISNDD